MRLVRLEWDSELFGFPAGRLEIDGDGGALRETLDSAREAGVRHLIARVPLEDISAINALESEGFELIDAIQTLSRSLHDWKIEPRTGARMYRPEDIEAVAEIGHTAYRFDRFHNDRTLPPGTADRVKQAWTRNCCLGEAADAVIVGESGGRVAGYVSCRMEKNRPGVGTVILVATAEWARGKGVARAMAYRSLDWFLEQGVTIVEVGTQLTNAPAACLYQTIGFRFSRASVTLRKWLPPLASQKRTA